MNDEQKKLENYSQDGSIKESFNTKREENSPFSDSFVFKHEENKITWTNEAKPHGKEENDDISYINKPHDEEGMKQEDIEKITNVGAKAGTTVTATAATVATAVVVVAGGVLAVNTMFINTPTITEISNIETTPNTISFNIAIGEDEEEANSSELGKECDIVVELKCLSYEEEAREVEFKNYGFSSGTFDLLTPKTDYSINIYQKSFLDLERTYLLDEPISVSTKMGRNFSISLEIETDPLGNEIYYSTVDFVNEMGIKLYNYYIGVFEEEPTSKEAELMGYANLDETDPFSRQKIDWNSEARGSEIYVALYAYTDDEDYIKAHYEDGQGQSSGRIPDEMEVYLFSNLVNLEEVEANKEQAKVENHIYAKRIVSEGSADETYMLYLGIEREDYQSVYERASLEAIELERAAGDRLQMTYPNNSQYDLPLNEAFEVQFSNLDFYANYQFSLKVVSHLQEDVDQWNQDNPNPSSGPATVDTGAEVVLYQTTIMFINVPVETVQVEPTLVGLSFLKVGTPENGYHLGLTFEINDPGYHIDSGSYSIYLSYKQDSDGLLPRIEHEYDVTKLEYSEYYIIEGIDESFNQHNADDLTYEFFAKSDYNQQFGRYAKVSLGTGTEDLTDLSETYIQGCLDLRWGPNPTVGDQYILMVEVLCDYSQYDYFYILIWDLDMNNVLADFNITEAFNEQAANPTLIDQDWPGNYVVETRGHLANGGYNETLFVETIDFGRVELSV